MEGHPGLPSQVVRSRLGTASELQVLCSRIYEIRVPDVISYTAAPRFVFGTSDRELKVLGLGVDVWTHDVSSTDPSDETWLEDLEAGSESIAATFCLGRTVKPETRKHLTQASRATPSAYSNFRSSQLAAMRGTGSRQCWHCDKWRQLHPCQYFIFSSPLLVVPLLALSS